MKEGYGGKLRGRGDGGGKPTEDLSTKFFSKFSTLLFFYRLFPRIL